ncbi:glycoside hydrolase family 43 protein [Leifsonia sp. fls2-241-R2A-40a]|uniref:glycoside hydrolase family 43 protein n=1 Tax=Leifsonia sp. fls2-241-R2A-40a TaxID=3040290 RepID=UPI002549F80A|nr:glycoside hydrolase family 43 protein [Leifsonia sp. fls2-241-R2A-40a]
MTVRRAAAAIGAAFALAAGLVGCSAGSGPSAEPSPSIAPFQIDSDFPDPGALVVGDRVYAYATNTPALNVQVATSGDMKTWKMSDQDALPTLPSWALPGKTWAPGPAKLADDRFALYFTASDAASRYQCIGVAFADKPEGPFASTADKPLVCPVEEGGAIDASVTSDADGQRYLVWKCGYDTWIHVQPLSADGASLTGEPTKLIKQTESWEGTLVEAPVIVRHGDEYVLLYSANDYSNSSYVTGVATAKSLLGPYTKSTKPLLSTPGSEGRYLGPGGEDLVTFRGRDWMLFHSWDEAFAYRGMHAVPVTWRNGLPELSS